jgi:hypothetical protein
MNVANPDMKFIPPTMLINGCVINFLDEGKAVYQEMRQYRRFVTALIIDELRAVL